MIVWHKCDGENSWVGIALEAEIGGRRRSIYLSMTPRDARDHAAEILKVADMVDGGRGKH